MKNPVTLPFCGHSFCKNCISNWSNSSPNKKTCPECRTDFGFPVEKLAINLKIKSLIDKFKVNCPNSTNLKNIASSSLSNNNDENNNDNNNNNNKKRKNKENYDEIDVENNNSSSLPSTEIKSKKSRRINKEEKIDSKLFSLLSNLREELMKKN